MTHKHLMIAIDWAGPYRSIADANKAAADDFDHGLYMCLGRCGLERKVRPQYIGIATSLSARVKHDHPALCHVAGDFALWLGEITTAEPSGKRMKVTKPTLDYAEWLHARFMDLPLNDRKKKSLPPRSVTVLNRWLKTDYETPRQRRPHADWPDLIDFPMYELPARAVWFGRRQRHFPAPDYVAR
ncbi:MAG: hypothetical protein HQ481_13150 [Alphaproteobacteria bacterium]|nr:hypothetical protein [Alphaproteobacteria bacterium]